jgi:molybdopterin-containing oxidoreductase family iron-sulfur binding subunit
MAACPYTGVRQFNWEEPRYHLDFATGDKDIAPHQKHTVEKCTLCANLLAKNEIPMCVEACVGNARFFGDLDDPTSEVARLVASRQHMQLLPEQGTNPSVYYLV